MNAKQSRLKHLYAPSGRSAVRAAKSVGAYV